MYEIEEIDRKIRDFRRMLAATNDPLAIGLIKTAIESLESERAGLLQSTKQPRD